MPVRSLLLILLLLVSGPLVAWAQPPAANGSPSRRIDILTGEPVRPRTDHPRPEPHIYNAPHAPLPPVRNEEFPLEIYVAPQIGTGTGILPGETGLNTPLPGRGLPLSRRNERLDPVRPRGPFFDEGSRLRR